MPENLSSRNELPFLATLPRHTSRWDETARRAIVIGVLYRSGWSFRPSLPHPPPPLPSDVQPPLTYRPSLHRGYARAYLKDLEAIRATSIIDIIHSGESLAVRDAARLPTQGTCSRCNYISSQAVCKACVLLQGLNQVSDSTRLRWWNEVLVSGGLCAIVCQENIGNGGLHTSGTPCIT